MIRELPRRFRAAANNRFPRAAGGRRAQRRTGWRQAVPSDGARRMLTVAILVAVLFVPLWDGAMGQNRTHTVFYEGTDHELHVYRIWGKKPGKTLLLIGGIQGDEPGGFLSADHYADLVLAQGNLIVVPRANFQSIVLQRRSVNEDMNRKFAEDRQENYETKIVRILKKLIQESNCVLNLHDGSGFYSDVWESDLRNPRRFGQSIIADADVYTHPDTGERIDLGAIARAVCREINREIEKPEYHFHFNNHRTHDADSPNREQRKSATYYALYSHGIPAFGIETSKSLPLELKVRHHNLAINAFMKRLGILPETPGLFLEKPEMHYLVITVNEALPIAVQNRQTLHVRAGDSITISHIEANYERGLSADVLMAGTMNDFRKTLQMDRPTRIVVRKDHIPCGSIAVELADDRGVSARPVSFSKTDSDVSMLLFRVKIDGRERLFRNHDRVSLVKGDTFEILDVYATLIDPSELIVNFKGFVGNRQNNTGEDRGYTIDTGRDLWPRYSVGGKGRVYPVIVKHGDTVVGKLFVELTSPKLEYVILAQDGGPKLCVTPDDTATVNPEHPLRLVSIRTNVADNTGVTAFVSSSGRRRPIALAEPFSLNAAAGAVSGSWRIDVLRGAIPIGSISLHVDRPPMPLSADDTADLETNPVEKKSDKES